VALARACFTDQNDGFLALQILALTQLLDQGHGDVRRSQKIELLQCLDRREVGLLDAPDYVPAIAFLDLGFEQRLQITQVRLLLPHRFFGQVGELVGRGGQIELPGVLLNRGLLDRLGIATEQGLGVMEATQVEPVEDPGEGNVEAEADLIEGFGRKVCHVPGLSGVGTGLELIEWSEREEE
jgi:hypothetical protein